MSGAIGAASFAGYGVMGSLVADSETVSQRLDLLTTQAATGLIGQTYAGLGTGAAISLDLRPQLADLQTWQNNINATTGAMGVTQTAMTQLQAIAANFHAQMDNLNGLNPSEVDSIAASARQALVQVAGLLDTTDGNTYVFGGADSANPPVPDPDAMLTSGFYTQINTAVGGLGGAGAAATAAATLAVASSDAAGTSPFSAYMSQPAAALQAQIPAVQTGAEQTQPVGLLASANTYVASTGSSTTGSYARDLMRALATIGSLSSAQVSDAGFQGLVADTYTSLGGVVTAMAEDAGVLGNQQTALTATGTQLADQATALTAQVSPVENVDMAQTLSDLTLVQTQLQSSYQLISGASGLSLVKFLPVG
ncbi:MAG: flagellin [Acetobacteraceae bacterium]